MLESGNALMVNDALGEHPRYMRSDWEQEVAAGNTRLDYLDWVDLRVINDTLDEVFPSLDPEDYLELALNDSLGG